MSIVGLVLFITAIVLYIAWYYIVAPRMIYRIRARQELMDEAWRDHHAELSYEEDCLTGVIAPDGTEESF